MFPARRVREGKELVPEALLRQARKSGQLNLSNRGLQTVPVEVLKLHDHESTQLSFVGQDEGQWWAQEDLTKLILACNQISHIPDDIVEFGSLQVLDLHDNLLGLLPTRIGKLKELRRLAVGHNQLVDLPGEMSSLVNLVSLHLEHNKLTMLGEYLKHLEQLEELVSELFG
jgi:Leucine-rich repeat (LRR) protein